MMSLRTAMERKQSNASCRPPTYRTDSKSAAFGRGGSCLYGWLNRPCWALPLAFLLAGCYANTAYVDVPGQALRPCSGSTLTAVSLQSQSPGSSFNIRWTGPPPLPAEIDLQQPAAGFRISSNGISLPSPAHFKLQPNTVYQVINHTHGDAGPDKLTFHTNASGLIDSASKSACE